MTDFPVWEDSCAHCGAENNEEDQEDNPFYLYECPTCNREGCPYCMPAGRGCECPSCEEGECESD